LKDKFGIASDVWSATSYPLLARQAEKVEWENRFEIGESPKPFVTQLLANKGPIIAVSDYVKALPRMICPLASSRYDRFGHRWIRPQ
jgi:pyruvate dehydrogenase E1 component